MYSFLKKYTHDAPSATVRYQITGNRPYLEIVWAYVPTTPTITSPVSGQNSKTTVDLSASSTVTSGTITYEWEYSLDGQTGWKSIGSTSASIYTWNIPTSIPDNSSIYFRCRAKANGVYSDYSSVVRINKTDDPAVAAKLAAELAKLAVENMDNKVENINSMVNDILQYVSNLENKDEIPPTITYARWFNNKSITTNTIETLYVDVIDNKTQQNNLKYQYSVNGGSFTPLANYTNQISVNLGSEKGLKIVSVRFIDENNNSVSVEKNIWRL